MTNTPYNDVAELLRHAKNDSIANSNEFDSDIDSPIVIAQIDLASQLATYFNTEFLDETQIELSDILDALASLGIVLSSLEDDAHRHNYASIAYSYALNANTVPEISEYLS